MTDPGPVPDGPDGDEFEILVPFIVCKSEGGVFDDDSFTAGFECATVYADLKYAKGAPSGLPMTPHEAVLRTDNVKQIDLLAMHLGYKTRAVVWDEDPAWSVVFFEFAQEEPE